MKQVCKRGFTILEWVISFFITVTILTVVFQFSAKIYSQLIGSSRFNAMFSDVTVALDAMTKNIFQAPAEKNKWKKISSIHIMWKDEQTKTVVGYLYEKQNLFFVKGKRKNVIARNLKNVKFAATVEREEIKSIRCVIAFSCHQKKYTVDRLIILKNGEIT